MTFHILLSCNPAIGQHEDAVGHLRQAASDLAGRSVDVEVYELGAGREQSNTGRPFRFTLIARGEQDPRSALKSLLEAPAFHPAYRLFRLQPISGRSPAKAGPLAPDLLQVCASALPGQDAAFEAFYEQTHFDELLAVPGFAAGQLFAVAEDQSPPDGEPHHYVSLWQLTDHALAGAELGKRRGTPALTPNAAGDRSKLDSAFYCALF